jgi:tRNA dimethylallyltransferase
MKFDAVLIAGPTASGKTQAALGVADEIDGAIVNADSMQIYRELRVLTARPSDAEMARLPHHLFGHVSVREHYSVGRYQTDAARALEQIRNSRKMPIFVGGTGLYFAALTDGLADMPTVPASVRAGARARLKKIGNDAFHAELALRDPEMATALRPSDTHRVLRAAEVLEATGRSLSAWQGGEGRAVLDGLNLAKFVLDVPRAELRDRIEARFRVMLEGGARAEAGALMDLDPALPAAKILGLRELNAASRGEISDEEAISLAVTRTRQFAKRQSTWFRNRMADWPRTSAVDESNIIAEILSQIA